MDLDFNQTLERLCGVRILVVGDMILDHYLIGTADRISPEAPVPVVLFQRETQIPGGAANVARNILAVGAQVACAGVVGDDEQGRLLIDLLEQDGADCSAILKLSSRPTTTKTRILAQNHQMLRLDREDARPVSADVTESLLGHCCASVLDCDAVIVSDYGKGALPPQFLHSFLQAAKAAGKPVFVDPKGRDYSRYFGATCLTPNAREAGDASGHTVDSDAGLYAAAAAIMAMAGLAQLVITRGAAGLALFEQGAAQPLLIPATAREVFDVTGAGDTFISWFAMCCASGLASGEACAIANQAAGIAVGKVGCATVSRDEMLRHEA